MRQTLVATSQSCKTMADVSVTRASTSDESDWGTEIFDILSSSSSSDGPVARLGAYSRHPRAETEDMDSGTLEFEIFSSSSDGSATAPGVRDQPAGSSDDCLPRSLVQEPHAASAGLTTPQASSPTRCKDPEPDEIEIFSPSVIAPHAQWRRHASSSGDSLSPFRSVFPDTSPSTKQMDPEKQECYVQSPSDVDVVTPSAHMRPTASSSDDALSPRSIRRPHAGSSVHVAFQVLLERSPSPVRTCNTTKASYSTCQISSPPRASHKQENRHQQSRIRVKRKRSRQRERTRIAAAAAAASRDVGRKNGAPGLRSHHVGMSCSGEAEEEVARLPDRADDRKESEGRLGGAIDVVVAAIASPLEGLASLLGGGGGDAAASTACASAAGHTSPNARHRDGVFVSLQDVSFGLGSDILLGASGVRVRSDSSGRSSNASSVS